MYLDIFLIVVMLVSGVLAMVRGFMREVLSIASWAAAAASTVYFHGRLLPFAQQYFNNDWVAKGVTIAGLFLGTLIIVSILTVRVSDMILDSRIGALDRTLGFLFGLARGLFIVVIAFVLVEWLVPQKSMPDAIRDAKSRVVLQGTGHWLMSLLPDDPESTILKRLRPPKGDEPDSSDASPDQRTDSRSPTEPRETAGYDRTDRRDMRQLIQTRAPASR